MLDVKRVLADFDEVKRRLATRGAVPGLDALQALDAERRAAIVEAEALKAERNESSKQIGALIKAGGDATAMRERVRAIGERITELDQRVSESEAKLSEILAGVPNLPHESLPVGSDESANRVERAWGAPRTFSFTPRDHVDLGAIGDTLDFERASKITGARFVVLKGQAARLERALVAFMMDLHSERHGYREVWPPFIVNRDSLYGTGQLPKFEADLFRLTEPGDWFLAPTAEVPVTNMHRGEILRDEELPIRYCAYTPCFRAEAGSHGRDVRGIIRQHQFDKVELVAFARPEESYDVLEQLTGHAEEVLRRLELPYRVVTLSTGDLGFSAAKTYDIEVWLPSQNTYREISSCSNFEDFQARRAEIRYRPAGGGKPRFVHTLNGSGLAVGRTALAIMENYQREDGSIEIPRALQPYMESRLVD